MDAHITATFSLLPFAAGKFSVLEARDRASILIHMVGRSQVFIRELIQTSSNYFTNVAPWISYVPTGLGK